MGEAALKLAAEPPLYDFTNNWFQETASPTIWGQIIKSTAPKRILEVGCYEGQATVYMIHECNEFGPISVTCIDTWEGAKDLSAEMMKGVEDRFDKNITAALEWSGTAKIEKIKSPSSKALPHLLSEGRRFDLIYVDASHTAPDVLSDAVDCFRLLREGGAMIFDDYVWCLEPHGLEDPLNMPKPAIDAFVNLYARKLMLMHISGQLALMKTHD